MKEKNLHINEPLEHHFYGIRRQVSNKRFKFDGSAHTEPDCVTVVTDNVRRFRDSLVLVVSNNQVVYLKDWQVRPIYCHDLGINSFAVKLNRKYFKPYTWKAGEFTDFYFDEPDTFETFENLVKEQANQCVWKPGHYGGMAEVEWLHGDTFDDPSEAKTETTPTVE